MQVECQLCHKVLNIIGSLDDIRRLITDDPKWVSQTFPCVFPLCEGVAGINYTAGVMASAKIPHEEVPVEVYYKAIHGFGLSVSPADPERVLALLLQHRVIKADLRRAGGGARTLVDRLVLDNGTQLHFATSSRGACVYYVEERTDDERHGPTSGDSQSPTEGREKAGRNLEVRGLERPPDHSDELHGRAVPALSEES